MFDILFSITAHENIEFLCHQIDNVLKFNVNSAIVIHINKEVNITKEEWNLLKDKPNVFINPNRINSRLYKALTPIMSNLLYSKEINFKYVCLLASNCFFFKSGLIHYLNKYDYGCYKFENNNFSGKWGHCREFSIFIGAKNNPNYSGGNTGDDKIYIYSQPNGEDGKSL